MAFIVGSNLNDVINPGFVSPWLLPVLPSDADDQIQGLAGLDIIEGGGGDDALYGDSGSDSLYGGDGKDRLDGGTGNDSMFGGYGSDEYFVDSRYDLVSEDAGGGYDRVRSSISYTLGAGLEWLDLMGTAITAVGNAADNRLQGTDGYSILMGLGGRDEMNGGGGDDGYDGGTGNDLINGWDGNETMLGQSGDDTFFGNGGSDDISGGSGADWIHAGGGNDVASGGSNDDNLGGEGGNDKLDGGSGDDWVSGGDGDDRLIGGSGADILVGEEGKDIFAFLSASDSTPADRNLIDPDVYWVATGFEWPGDALGDLIDISEIDANTTTAANDAFIFGGTGKGHLSVVDDGALSSLSIVRGNTDNDAAFEFEVAIEDSLAFAAWYDASDFDL